VGKYFGRFIFSVREQGILFRQVHKIMLRADIEELESLLRILSIFYRYI
jgi:hypothetical protein